MADTNQQNPEQDAEYDRIRSITPGLGDESSPEEVETQIEDETPPSEEDLQSETTPPEPAPEPEPASEDDDEEEEEDPPASPTRPEKYIPVKQYTSEKKEWKEKVEILTKQLEAASIATGQAKEDKIKAYAEKHGVTEESVRELLSLHEIDTPEAKQELDEGIQAQLAEAEELKAEKLFETEFTTVAVPELKKLYPTATDAQLAAAKAEIEKLATTRDFLDKPLDYVVYKNQGKIASLFVQGRRGPETSRTAPEKQPAEYTAQDFSAGKTSFEVLGKLPVGQQTKIVEDMDYNTYDRYTRFLQQNDTISINRGGKRINLK